MKKILILSSMFIICFSSMSFKGCIIQYFWQAGIEVTNAISGTRYDYGDNSVPIHYTISVGNNGRIMRSFGTTNLVFEQIVSGTSQNLNSVRLANNPYQDEGAIVGNSGTVLVTENAGVNWTLKTPVSSANLYGVDHSFYLYAVGDNGTILYANNLLSGSLISRNSGTTRNLKAVTISIVNSQRVIAVGEKGTIVRTINGGIDWENVSIPDTTFNFYDLSQKGIHFTSDVFCAVGSGGRIYKSTDVGATWQQKPSGTSNTLRDIYFHSPDSGVVVGDNGTIRFTTNGGETWFSEPFFNSPSTRNYKSVSFIFRDNKTFTALSDSLFFFSEDPITVGIEPVISAVPNGFSLSQNYPNPFNPTTNFGFRIADFGFVQLKIYDQIGQEIAVLVNEELKPGTYSFEWNAANKPSGVYFYRLVTDGFTDTKKMVLVK